MTVAATTVATAVVGPAAAQSAERPSAPACDREGSAGLVWQSTGGRDHPLIGSVLAAKTGAMLTRAQFETLFVERLLPSTQIVLIGESHDNADHHALQAKLIGLFACATKAPRAAVFEHIRRDQQPALDRFVALHAGAGGMGTASDLLRLLDWDNSGWPAAGMFAPLFQAVISGRLAILPGDPVRQQVRAVARGEGNATTAAEQARLGLNEPLPEALANALAAELRGSHCGQLPEQAIPGMAAAQRYRDALLADQLLAAVDQYGAAVLLAGNGHVRDDRGAPWYVEQRSRQRQLQGASAVAATSISPVEVEDGVTDASAYSPRAPDKTAAVDYIVFTPRAMRSDPCEQMRSPKAGRG